MYYCFMSIHLVLIGFIIYILKHFFKTLFKKAQFTHFKEVTFAELNNI